MPVLMLTVESQLYGHRRTESTRIESTDGDQITALLTIPASSGRSIVTETQDLKSTADDERHRRLQINYNGADV